MSNICSPLPVFASRTILGLPMIFHFVGVDEFMERLFFISELETIYSL
jgi:hypothetical protein